MEKVLGQLSGLIQERVELNKTLLFPIPILVRIFKYDLTLQYHLTMPQKLKVIQ